jgi:hypothetical protein
MLWLIHPFFPTIKWIDSHSMLLETADRKGFRDKVEAKE